jgi:hypothetical protein
MKLIEGSETSAISNQTPGKHPKENILRVKHGESLKSRNKTIFNLYTLVGLLSTAESDRAVPWPDVARGGSTARLSGGKTAAARLADLAAGSAAQRGLKMDFVYLLNFFLSFKPWNLDYHSYGAVFKPMLVTF